MEKAINGITGGMDTDSDLRAIAPGDYRFASYLRNGSADTSNEGVGENIPGNAVVLPEGLTGEFLIVGAAEWVEKNRNQVVLAYCDFAGEAHSWVLYDRPTDVLTVLSTSKHYNFRPEPEYRMAFNCHVVNGVLYWTDGYFNSHLINATNGVREFNPPRCINLQKLIDGDYSAISFELLDAVKAPPTRTPLVVAATDTTRKINRIYGLGIRFIYCFIYENNEVSKWSPPSEICRVENSNTIIGKNPSQFEADNKIVVTIATGNEIVKKIRVAATVLGHDKNFYIFKEIDKAQESVPDNNVIDVDFYNDRYTEPVSNLDSNSDAIPDVAGAQVVLPNKTHISYGDISEGFNNVEVDITLSLRRQEITSGIATAYPDVVCCINAITTGVTHEFTIGAGSIAPTYPAIDNGGTYNDNYWKFYEGDIIPISYQYAHLILEKTAYYTVTAADITAINAAGTASAKRIYLNNTLMTWALAQFGITAVSTGNDVNDNATAVINDSPPVTSLYAYLKRKLVIRKTKPKLTLTPGEKRVGVVYLDRASRDGTVQFSPLTSVYVPYEPEDAAGRTTFANANAPYAIRLTARVNHYPPEFATDYVFVEQEAPIPSKTRRTARNIDTDPNYPSLYRISLCKPYHSGSIIQKEIKENDLLTFISNGVTFDTTVGFNVPLTYCETLIQIPIVRYSTNEGYEGLECVYIPRINLESCSGPLQNFVIDIETVNKESNSYVYREISPIYRISAPHTINRAHRGNVQDQTSVLPAIVDLDNYGDTWLRPRAMLTNYVGYMDRIIMWTKDPHYSDYYLSEWTDKGRYQIFNPNNRRLEQSTAIVHSGKFADSTLVNGLSAFDALDRVTLQPSHGKVLAMINKGGSVLTIIQAKKETSIYIQQTFGVGGDSNVPMLSDKIFGHVNPLKENYGCMHKEKR